MPRPLIVSLAVIVALSSAVAAFGQTPPAPAPPGADLRKELLPAPPPPLGAAAAAGLPVTSEPVTLTWERAYALAIVRARSKERGIAESLDPRALDEQAERLGAADFDRFRREFVAGEPFHDPGPSVFGLLRHLHSVETARRDVASYQHLLKLVRDMWKAERVYLVQLDQVDAALQRSRLRLIRALTAYRDGLDALKLDLGLSLRAPVVADRAALAPFLDAFSAADRWFTDPNRDFAELPRLAQRLPMLDDVWVDPRTDLSLAQVAMTGPFSEHLDELLTAAARVGGLVGGAEGKAPDAAADKELRIRRRLRALADTYRAYESEKPRFVLALRQKDGAFEQLIAAPTAKAGEAVDVVLNMTRAQEEVRQVEDRLVALWASYQSGRLVFYRDLGTLPYLGWPSFYATLSARPGKPGPMPGRPAAPAPGR